MMKINRTRQRLQNGETCIGTLVREIRSPQVVQLLAAAGWDFIILDTEHGPLDMHSVADFASVAFREDMTLLVRIPDNLYHLMARVLDLGAEGLMCPRVDNRQEAIEIVQAIKYAPLGCRGVGMSGITTAYRPVDLAEHLNFANKNTLIIVQIESVTALEGLHEILSVPGIDVALVGPADLSQSMGIPGQYENPRMVEACEQVISACKVHGVAPGMHFMNLDLMRGWISCGMRFATYGTDFSLLQEASCRALAELRA
jgi:2-keto-3-deoxy-L-rhamnonate aldolase RhmA